MAAAPPRPFRFGAQAFEISSGRGVDRLGPPHRGPRVQHAVHHRPLLRSGRHRRDVRPPAGRRGTDQRHDGRRRGHPACASAAGCSTWTSTTPSCWPRSWPRSTCCRTGGWRSASAPGGWRPSTRASTSRWTARRPHRPARRGGGADEGALERRGRRRRRHLRPRHGFTGLPRPVQQPHPPVLIGGGRERILTLAGRMADIVSFNYDNSAGASSARAAWPRRGGRDGPKGGVGAGRRRRPLRRHRARDRRLLRGRRRPSRARRGDGRAVRGRAEPGSRPPPCLLGSGRLGLRNAARAAGAVRLLVRHGPPAQHGRLRARRGPHGRHTSESGRCTFLDDVRALASRHRPWMRGMQRSSTRAHRPGCSS